MSEEVANKDVVQKDMVEKDTELRRLFGRLSFLFKWDDDENNPDQLPPLKIEVKFLPVERFIEFFDLMGRLGTGYFIQGKQLWELVAESVSEVKQLLVPLVSVPSSPTLTLDDLPADVLPECLGIVLDSISPKKWQSLGAKLEEKYGISGWLPAEMVPMATEAPSGIEAPGTTVQQ